MPSTLTVEEVQNKMQYYRNWYAYIFAEICIYFHIILFFFNDGNFLYVKISI